MVIVKLLGDVAQLVERLLCKQDVAGSTPVISTIERPRLIGVFLCRCYNKLMFTLNSLLIGIAMVVIGVLGVKYAFWLHNMTGPQDWLERFTGPGSTQGMYKIFFTLVVITGLLVATGFGNNVMSFLFSPLKNLFHPLSQ
jgi:nucleoside recognition membrane protein YjiH